jgi:hypothetical protein
MLIGKACEAFVNGMAATPGAEKVQERYSWVSFVAAIIAFVIVLLILAFIGKYLWKNSIVPLVSVARPAASALQILGLYVFVALLSN